MNVILINLNILFTSLLKQLINRMEIRENNEEYYYCDKCDNYILITELEDHNYCHSLEEPIAHNHNSAEAENEEIKRLKRESKRPVEYQIDNPLLLPKDKQNCVICITEFQKADTVLSLPCLHIFHKECIVNWLNKNSSCPLCKYEVSLVLDIEINPIKEKINNPREQLLNKLSHGKKVVSSKLKWLTKHIINKSKEVNNKIHDILKESPFKKNDNDNVNNKDN